MPGYATFAPWQRLKSLADGTAYEKDAKDHEFDPNLIGRLWNAATTHPGGSFSAAPWNDKIPAGRVTGRTDAAGAGGECR